MIKRYPSGYLFSFPSLQLFADKYVLYCRLLALAYLKEYIFPLVPKTKSLRGFHGDVIGVTFFLAEGF